MINTFQVLFTHLVSVTNLQSFEIGEQIMSKCQTTILVYLDTLELNKLNFLSRSMNCNGKFICFIVTKIYVFEDNTSIYVTIPKFDIFLFTIQLQCNCITFIINTEFCIIKFIIMSINPSSFNGVKASII